MRRNILFSILISVVFIVSFVNDTKAQTLDERASSISTELDSLRDAGVKGVLYWMYSGSASDAFGFGSDQYSFFEGDPICGVLKSKSSNFDMIGVNIPSLGTTNDRVPGSAERALQYLSSECGINTIRIFGFPDRGGVARTVSMVNLAQSYNLKVIVALCDYANGCADLGISGSVQANPTSWYTSGYTLSDSNPDNYSGSYLDYAGEMAQALAGNPGLYAIELLNEPHCSGNASCVDPYINWASTVSGIIQSNGVSNVGIGQMASQNTTRGDSPGAGSPADYLRSNDSSTITVSSAHYYNDTEKTNALQAYTHAQSLGKLFYIGEFGLGSTDSPVAGNRPLDHNFHLGNVTACNDVRADEFHPLRPYPVSPCELRIPQSKPEAPFLIEERPSGSQNLVRANRYINYACGTSIDFEGLESFDPHGYGTGDLQSSQGTVTTQGTDEPIDYAHTVCEPETYICRPGEVCPELTCYRTLRYEIETDFRDSNVGILGNTQIEYPDKELVNNYLSWYFTGVPQIGDHEPLVPYVEEDEYRLVNFSGPLRKLLPFDAQNSIRSVIAASHGQNPDTEIADTHNYIVGCRENVDLAYFIEIAKAWLDVFSGNISDLIKFFTLLWNVGESEGFKELGELLHQIAQRPELLEPQNRPELVAMISSTFPDLLLGGIDFVSQLISLGVENIRRIALLIASIKTDTATSCSVSNEIQRLDLYDTDPDGTNGEYLPYPDGYLPPDPHDPRYTTFEEFWEAYNEWRGTDGAIASFIYSPFPHLSQEIWAQLFPHIPLSGLEDIAGEEFFTGYGQGVGPYSGSDDLITAPGQLNIIEAVPAEP